MSNRWSNLIEVSLKDDATLSQVAIHISEIDSKTEFHSTPLHFAVLTGNVATAAFLIDSKQELVNRENRYGETPLHWACKEANVEVVTLLIDSGADVNCIDTDGNSPLHWAAEYDRDDIAQVLFLHGTKANTKNTDHKTALDVAIESGSKRYLKKYGPSSSSRIKPHLHTLKTIFAPSN